MWLAAGVDVKEGAGTQGALGVAHGKAAMAEHGALLVRYLHRAFHFHSLLCTSEIIQSRLIDDSNPKKRYV